MFYPFNNPQLPLDERIRDLLSRLSVEEKISWVPTYQAAVERLGISPYYIGGEGAHGFVDRKGPSTTFPQTQGLASSWDKKLLGKIGNVIGKEARSWYNSHDKRGCLSLWFPTIDMEKDPRWGRTEEAYGEDPFLAGTLAVELIRQAQGDHPFYLQISCAPKHFFANNNEKDRIRCSCSVDPRNMHEYYLESFRRAFVDGKACSLMTAYNEVNGIPMMQHPAVRDLVKKEWGLEERGHVVTDGGDFLHTVDHHHYFKHHYETLAAAFHNGVDTMTDNAEEIIKAVKEALDHHLITPKDLDEHLAQTLKVRFRFGQFDPPGICPYEAIGEADYMHPDYRIISREAVQKSAVLLKNEGDLLPLHPEKKQKILVTGPLASRNYPDWYTGEMDYQVTILEGLKQRFGEQQISFCDWRDIVSFETAQGRPLVLKGEDNILAAGRPGEEAARFYLEDWGWGAVRLFHLESGLLLDAEQPMADHQPSDEELAQMKKDMVLKAHKKDSHNWFVTTQFSILPQENGLVLMKSWNGSRFIAPMDGEEIKLSQSAVPGQEEYFSVHYHRKGVEELLPAAAEADVCLTFLGNHPLINGKEEMDRPDITLPLPQQNLVQQIYEVQKNTAAIMVSSYPLACNWLQQHLPALMYIAHGMQEMGKGLADIISGDESPAGRLSMTWYRSVQDLPEMMEYDIIQSDNTYQYFKGDSLYPFGYGLSYSHFHYEDLQLSHRKLKEEESLEIRFKLSNQGKVTSDEVPQLYISIAGSRVKRPLKSLKGYDRIRLNPGESRELCFTLPWQELAVWDVTREQFTVEKGQCTIQIGASSEDIRLKDRIEVAGEIIPPRKLDLWTFAENYDGYRNCYLHEKRGHDRAGVFSKKDMDHRDRAWLIYKHVDFTAGASRFEAIISSQGASELSFHLQDPQGPCLGTMLLPNTGDICAVPHESLKADWAWVEQSLKAIDGIQDFCIVIKGQAAIHRFRLS